MSGSDPTKPGDKPDANSDAKPAAPGSRAPIEKQSGRVTFDARGNAVWEWSMATGIFDRNVDTRRLKKLEAKDLKILDDPPKNQKPAAGGAVKFGGGDPYNSSGGGRMGGGDPYNSSGPALAPRKKPSKPKDLKRLSDWIQTQKGLQLQDDDPDD